MHLDDLGRFFFFFFFFLGDSGPATVAVSPEGRWAQNTKHRASSNLDLGGTIKAPCSEERGGRHHKNQACRKPVVLTERGWYMTNQRRAIGRGGSPAPGQQEGSFSSGVPS